MTLAKYQELVLELLAGMLECGSPKDSRVSIATGMLQAVPVARNCTKQFSSCPPTRPKMMSHDEFLKILNSI